MYDQMLKVHPHEEILEVPIDSIRTNPYQPRRQFQPEELEGLAASIKSVGLIHPPVVRPMEEGQGYELVAGERRLRASILAGFTRIPVLVRVSADAHSAQAALIENIQRVDLNPLEIAKALKELMEEFGWSQEELGRRVGKKRSTVANYLRLLSLPQSIQNSLYEGKLTMGHAKAILSVEGVEKQMLIHELILRDDLTVRQAEETARRIEEKDRKQALVYAEKDIYLDFLAEKIQARLGTKVVIKGRGEAGQISIDYYSLDDLDRLLNLWGVDP
jgi:ParB family chromosome partitioning protein